MKLENNEILSLKTSRAFSQLNGARHREGSSNPQTLMGPLVLSSPALNDPAQVLPGCYALVDEVFSVRPSVDPNEFVLEFQ